MKRRQKRDGWFSVRGYPHLDSPLSFERASALVTKPKEVELHAFLPLLGYADIKRHFRTDNSDRAIPRRLRKRIVKSKQRDIKYAAHADSAIFSYYAMMLQASYEIWLTKHDLENCIIGYRAGIGSNVDMAAEAFAEVAARGTVTALCFDISNFFPSISHAELKAQICAVMEFGQLPPDWYKVFRACTKFSHVDFLEISKLFNFSPDDAPKPLVNDIGPAMQAIRGSHLLSTNKKSVEIPQGTPISAVFANVSMARFDLTVGGWAASHGAYYRRYSDDILLLVDPALEAEASKLVTYTASIIGEGLEIHPDKTDISRFVKTGEIVSVGKALTYLGFTYDGDSVFLRDRTLSRYYRRMTYAARGTVRGAGKAGQPATKAFRRAVFRDLSHLGSANFYNYARRAHPKFHKSRVKQQLRRHFAILLRKLENGGR